MLARYESELKRCISEIVISEVGDPEIGWITVQSVKLSPDYRKAVVLISVLGEAEVSLRALRRASGFIRSSLARKLPWRSVPKLEFQLELEGMIDEQGLDLQ